ncbi:uncharacterized protein LOC127800109 [Diospyros lotus]|uniref:uncharacterized protein LOC127800109 n=1 Tax=Diospyros lotus TaxID=55363 RepID=UPI002258771C|nr:uncharacterized protein LOC127800109 [Diospyros lotus]
MFSNLEINMFKFEHSFSGNVMEENTNAILSGKQFGNHNHLMEVKFLGQNDSLVSVDSFFPNEQVSEKIDVANKAYQFRYSGNEPIETEKSTVLIEVSEVVSITKGREHATLEGENTANSVVEATELHEAASDTDSRTKNQMPEFTIQLLIMELLWVKF